MGDAYRQRLTDLLNQVVQGEFFSQLAEDLGYSDVRLQQIRKGDYQYEVGYNLLYPLAEALNRQEQRSRWDARNIKQYLHNGELPPEGETYSTELYHLIGQLTIESLVLLQIEISNRIRDLLLLGARAMGVEVLYPRARDWYHERMSVAGHTAANFPPIRSENALRVNRKRVQAILDGQEYPSLGEALAIADVLQLTDERIEETLRSLSVCYGGARPRKN